MSKKTKIAETEKISDDPRVEFLYKHGMHATTTEQFLSDAERVSPVTWSVRKRKVRGGPYVFSDSTNPYLFRPWLKQPLRDQSKFKVLKKSRQIGASEIGISEFFWFLDAHERTKGVYTLPTDPFRDRFVTSRVNEAIEESEYLKSVVTLNNTGMKKIRNSFAIFTGAGAGTTSKNTRGLERKAEGIDADYLVFDEKDRMSSKIEIAFKETLSASRFGYRREYSTPTVPNFGISKSFNSTSQNYYFMKCGACNHWQYLKYPENLIKVKNYRNIGGHVPEDAYKIVCEKCKKEIDRMKEGTWVAKERSLEGIRAGYYVNQLNAPWYTASQIMEKQGDYPFENMWWNYVLGMEYAGDDLLVSEEIMRKCIDPTRTWVTVRDNRYVAIVVGIDWGTLNWGVVSGLTADGKFHLLNIIITKDARKGDALGSTRELAQKIAVYQPDLIVADAGYGKDRVALLQELFPGRAFACFYTDSKASKLTAPRWEVEKRFSVTLDRTLSIKQYFNYYKLGGRIWVLPKEDEKLMLFMKHNGNLVLIREQDEDTKETTERIDKTGDDHLAHAANYSAIGLRYMIDGGLIANAASFNFGFIDPPSIQQSVIQQGNQIISPANTVIPIVSPNSDFGFGVGSI